MQHTFYKQNIQAKYVQHISTITLRDENNVSNVYAYAAFKTYFCEFKTEMNLLLCQRQQDILRREYLHDR